MKHLKSYLISLFILLVVGASANAFRAVCLFYDSENSHRSAYELTRQTCLVVEQVLRQIIPDLEFEMANFDRSYLQDPSYDLVYMAGFGVPQGYYEDPLGNSKLDWCLIAQYTQADYLLIDACYSGSVFLCPSFNPEHIITSTGPHALSVNMGDVNDPVLESLTGNLTNISTFVYMLWKMVNNSCDYDDPQICHLQLNIDEASEWGTSRWIDFYNHPEEHPSLQIGVVYHNGSPMRDWPF